MSETHFGQGILEQIDLELFRNKFVTIKLLLFKVA